MIVRCIILTYNSLDETLEAVQRVTEQDEPGCQIVVVDNASRPEITDRLRISLPPTVKLVVNEKNLGYAAGNNRGCGQISGLDDADFYFFLNNDAFLNEPDTIRQLRQALQQDSQAVAISPLIHTMSNPIPVREQIQVRRLLSPIRIVVSHSPILCRMPGFVNWYNQFIYKDLVPIKEMIYSVESINGAAFMIDSHFFENNNRFDEGTFFYGEELILGQQIKLAGYHCLLHGRHIVTHLHGSATRKNTEQLDKWMHNHFVLSEQYLLKKYFDYSSNKLVSVRMLRSTEFLIKQLWKRFF